VTWQPLGVDSMCHVAVPHTHTGVNESQLPTLPSCTAEGRCCCTGLQCILQVLLLLLLTPQMVLLPIALVRQLHSLCCAVLCTTWPTYCCCYWLPGVEFKHGHTSSSSSTAARRIGLVALHDLCVTAVGGGGSASMLA
jgi:hypothetical protein